MTWTLDTPRPSWEYPVEDVDKEWSSLCNLLHDQLHEIRDPGLVTRLRKIVCWAFDIGRADGFEEAVSE